MSEKPHEYNYPTSFDFSEWKRLWKYIVFLKKPFLWLLLASIATALFDAIFPYFSR